MNSGYPIVLDVRDRQIVIVGGGRVAARKVKGLLSAGAIKIRVISPQFHAEIPSQIERITANYDARYLNEASLVFAATDSTDVNETVARDAREIGAWVCRADLDDAGDFSTPAMHRDGNLLMTISSGSPALSTLIRDGLAEAIEPRWVKMAAAMQTLRPMIQEKVAGANRRKIFVELIGEDAFAALERGEEELMKWLREKFPEISD
jgi:precorrin-2 dehydrogenase/sirohydrochlorin ferrochelatase